ncbi:MAG: metalloregulator ArsR/SmtB family transcription factor [Pseudomonadota bacterium]
MDIKTATSGFGALSQETRLEVIRRLIRAGSRGMLSGEIGDALGVRQNTMSANLTVLLNAGLIRNEREGRTIRYFVDLDGLGGLLEFLMRDCCGGRPELCRGLIDQIAQQAEGATT